VSAAGDLRVGGRARAAVLVEPGRYETREYPIPDPPPGGAIVAISRSGICGTDKHTWQGWTEQYGGSTAPRTIRFPLIQGHENVGRILALGGPVTDFEGRPVREGDRVVVSPNVSCGSCWACTHLLPYTLCERTEDYGNTLSAADPPHLLGGWAEAMVVLPGSHLFPVPDDLPDDVAVMAELMAVTVGLDRARSWSVLPSEPFLVDDTVVVYGTGPLGLGHVIKARMLGAGTIIAIDRSPERLAFARELGADVTLDVRDTTEDERLTRVRDLTGGRGADVVVEAAGVPEVVPAAIDLLRPGGLLIEVGNFSDGGEVLISPHRHLCSKGIRLMGVAGEEPGAYLPAMRQLARHRSAIPAIDRFVSDRFALADADTAMRRSIDPSSRKVVFAP
jgi:L-iditol 2-dehydrogenase